MATTKKAVGSTEAVDPAVEEATTDEEQTGLAAAFGEDAEVEDTPEVIEGVRYNGNASTRVITAEEWERAGIEGVEKDSIWNLYNAFTLPRDQFTTPQLRILKADGSFTIGKK